MILNSETMTHISKKVSKRFDTDILNRHAAASYKESMMAINSKHIITQGDLVNGHYFAFPTFDDLSITELIRVALKCFLSAATTTSFTFVLPASKKASWWPLLTKYFEIILEIESGSKCFSQKNKEGKYVECSCSQPIVVVHISKDSSIRVDNWLLAHCRFNHMGGSTLNRMIGSGANLGLVFKEASSFILCHVCHKCKATRPAVRDLTGKIRSALPSPLHELYMDIHGPISPESTLGYRYVIGFICSATGYAFIYFLKRKSESVTAARDLITYLLASKDLPVDFDPSKLTIISDNAKEFTDAEFQKLCETHRIKHDLTSPYAHHQALFIERLWRTLADASRTMLATAGLDNSYWPLAFKHAVHVYRRMPHRTRDESTATESPYFKLYKVEPDLTHLRIFGSDAFSFIEKSAREGGKMIAKRAKYGKYVGHEENLQTILMLDTENKKVYRGGLVKIIENVDEVGRVISNPDVSVPSYQYAEHDSSLYTRPTPFTKKENFKNLTQIHAIATFYDDSDKETYGLVQFTDSTHTETWTLAINILYYMTKETIFKLRDMLYNFLDSIFGPRTGNQNIHFPIFTRVTCVYDDKPYGGIIVSTDAHSKLGYGVILYDTDSNSVLHQDVSAGDIHEFNVDILYKLTDNLLPEPTTHRGAMSRPDAHLWREAENTECDAMFNRMQCLDSIPDTLLPSDAVVMPMRWVYKIKFNSDGSVERYKARLVVQGFRQIANVHYDADSTFSPSASALVLRMFLFFIVNFALCAFSMDVTAAFLNSKPKYDNYIRLPDGFTFKGSRYAYMLKNIYGTRDAARGWYDDQHAFLMTLYPELVRSSLDPCFYYILTTNVTVFMVVTVDDYAIATNEPRWYGQFIQNYRRKYACRDLGVLSLYNGIKLVFSANRSSARLSQQREILALLDKFHMADCNPARTPMTTDFAALPRTDSDSVPVFDYPSLIGALLWIARMTRPDILFAVITLSAYMKTYTSAHVLAAKRIVRYLKGTVRFSLVFRSDPDFDPDSPNIFITSQSDADWGGDTVTRRSMSGAITKIDKCLIIATCKRQAIVALSTMEAELIALTEAARDHMSLRNFINDIINSNNPIIRKLSIGKISTDNIATQFVAMNRIFNNRTRHIDIRYMFIRDQVEHKTLTIDRVDTTENTSDIFTKALSYDVFIVHRLGLGVEEDENEN
jgi:hypothetical protein